MGSSNHPQLPSVDETHGLASKMLEAVNAHLARKGQSLPQSM